MQAYRIAPRPGSVVAPRVFLQTLRRETRNANLHGWWDPTCNRTVKDPDGQDETRLGCWVVWQRVSVIRYSQVGRHTVGVSTKKYVSVFHLDGEYGNPTGIGPWVTRALNVSDVMKRGGSGRAKFLNDINERDAMRPHHEARAFAEDFTKDKMVKRLFQKSAERRGVPIKTKEDVNAELRVLEAKNRADWARAEAIAKSHRFRREWMP